ncbi:MAG: FAD-dependent oxidoreductase [Chloroflexota bacterium]|nr:FAD-dependent oxidoreductase [Chloroflexota bacterium]
MVEDFVVEPEKRTPIFRRVDVCVVGGSPSGVAAAVCAARNGASVLLLERNPYLGGQSVGTMVTQWEKRAYINNLGAVCTRGIAKEFLDAIVAKGESDRLWEDPPGSEEMRDGEEWLDPESIKLVLVEFCQAAGVDVLWSTLVVDTVVSEGESAPRVEGVIIENKSGRQAVLADVVVDASADLDVVWHAMGEEGVIVRPVEERIPGGIYTYYGGVDNGTFVEYCLGSGTVQGYPRFSNPDKVRRHLRTDRLILLRGFADVVEQAAQEGLLEPFYKMQQDYGPLLEEGNLADGNGSLSMKWVGRDRWIARGSFLSLKPFDMTRTEEVSKREMLLMRASHYLLPILQRIPGWDHAYVARTAQRMGRRETRVLRAVTMLGKEDIFDPDHDRADAIGRSGAHDPGKNRLWRAYPVPYGMLVPQRLDGVICAARALGFKDRVALDAHRGITPTMVVGQAAGTAAALAVQEDVEIRDVDLTELRRALRLADVVLDVETRALDTIPYHMGNGGRINHADEAPFA